MKSIISIYTVFFTLLVFLMPAGVLHAAKLSLKIEGQKARDIYEGLTGYAVQNEGAAGHVYRKGKNILCRYTQADMDDSKGNPVSPKDTRRYTCAIRFSHNGIATPGSL